MVKMKVMRKKTMIVEPRRQDIEEKSLVEQTGGFLPRSC